MASWSPASLNGRPAWYASVDGVTYVVCDGPTGGEATVLAGGMRRFLPGHSPQDDMDALRLCARRFHQRLMAAPADQRQAMLLSPGIAA